MAAGIRVDISGAVRKLNRANKKVVTLSQKTVDSLTEMGKNRAKQIAPYYTGKTAKLIRRLPARQRKEGVSGAIIAPNPTKSRSNFNLVKWMHKSNGILRGRKHIKSGEPQFMYKTSYYLEKIKRRVALANFKNSKL